MNEAIKTNPVLEDIQHLTLSEIVKNDFRAAAIFEKYDMDFCCRGKKLISQACEEKGVDQNKIIEELGALNTVPQASANKFDEWEPDFLIDYIINNHHSYVVKMIPVIAQHAEKVSGGHSENHPELLEIKNKFEVVYKDLKQHLLKEEQILFPYIKAMVKANKGESKFEPPYFGTVENPIRMMEAEHEAAGDEMFGIRELSKGYTIPEDACNGYRVFYQELKAFEEDLHAHIHLENNILFPKAKKLEKKLNGNF